MSPFAEDGDAGVAATNSRAMEFTSVLLPALRLPTIATSICGSGISLGASERSTFLRIASKTWSSPRSVSAETPIGVPNPRRANSPSATQSNSSAQGSATQSTTDQSTTTTTTHKHRKNADNSGNLPQTASPLPLLGLLGMGSLAAGMATRKRKRS